MVVSNSWFSNHRLIAFSIFIFFPAIAFAGDGVPGVESGTTDCGKFRSDIETRFGADARVENLPADEALDVMDLCLGRFAKCDMPICNKWLQSAAQTPPAVSAPAAPVVSAPPAKVVESAPIVAAAAAAPAVPVAPAEPVVAPVAPVPLIEQNPLAWLEKQMSCDEFRDQIRARYAPLGSYSKMPMEKKQEVDKVLEFACTERFASCGFSKCQGAQPAGEQLVKKQDSAPAVVAEGKSSNQSPEEVGDRPVQMAALVPEVATRVPTAEEIRAAAVSELSDLVKDHRRRLQQENEANWKRAGGVSWQRVAMAEELRLRAKKPRPSRPAASAYTSPRPSQPAYQYQQSGSEDEESFESDTSEAVVKPAPARRRAARQKLEDPNEDERENVSRVPTSAVSDNPPPIRAF